MILLMITTALIVRVPAPAASGYGKYILTFVRGLGSVRVHLSTILRVQVWFRFTEVKFCWFRFGSGSPKWNGSFGFTVRVQVRFDTLNTICILLKVVKFLILNAYLTLYLPGYFYTLFEPGGGKFAP